MPPCASNRPAKPLADLTDESRPSEMGQGYDSLRSLEEEDLAKRHPWVMWAPPGGGRKRGRELSNEGHYKEQLGLDSTMRC